MSLSDNIADMLTRIRNANRIQRSEAMVRKSKTCMGIAAVLKEEGYIRDYDAIDDGRGGLLRVQLKYGPTGEHVINTLDRVSRPGRRVYCPCDEVPQVMDGLGVAIVSTNKGVLSDRKCREMKVGGELLCTVS